MSRDWAEQTAQQLLSRGLLQTGTCLILGAADTGKTTLAAALAKHAALSSSRRVGIIDADIGQSHIGPPATVGWALFDKPGVEFSQLTAGGISFVGDVTPVGHLLQLTAAIVQCVRQVSEAAELVIIDTPGLVYGPAAAILWWTVQRILQPELILAVQRNDELQCVLGGLQSVGHKLEQIGCPPQMPTKSPQERQKYRQGRFARYFQNAEFYNINLRDIAVQPGRSFTDRPPRRVNRLVALRNGQGIDVALGIITGWQQSGDVIVLRAPKLDITQICCLVIGDVTIDIVGE